MSDHGNNVILFQPPNGPVAIMRPCNCGLTTKQIGEKDVPEGLPFWIVPDTLIPTDTTYRDAWRLDPAAMGSPDGVGGPK